MIYAHSSSYRVDLLSTTADLLLRMGYILYLRQTRTSRAGLGRELVRPNAELVTLPDVPGPVHSFPFLDLGLSSDPRTCRVLPNMRKVELGGQDFLALLDIIS